MKSYGNSSLKPLRNLFTRTCMMFFIDNIRIVTYWSALVIELTGKILIDMKCFPCPKIILELSLEDKTAVREIEQNLLLVYHAYNIGSTMI